MAKSPLAVYILPNIGPFGGYSYANETLDIDNSD